MMQRLFVFLVSALSILSAFALDNRVKVSLITCYPGPLVYELYGHTALRVQQGVIDEAFNYGVFDFNSPNFTYRFVKGDADYMVAHYPFSYFLEEYRRRGSKVVEQELNLSQSDSQRLLYRLLENCEPQNRNYRYDYIRDNCSTRPRDMVEAVVGKSLSYYPDSANMCLTYRDIMRRYNANYPWQSFGIDLALGGELDVPIDYRSQMFAPIYLMNAFGKATYTDSVGSVVPLVANTRILVPGDNNGSILPPSPWWQSPAALSWLMFLVTVLITVRDVRRGKILRIFDTVVFTVYSFAGCIIFFLVFVSLHAATDDNLVALWLHPFYIVPAILVWIKCAERILNWYHFITFAELIAAIAIWTVSQQRGDAAFLPLMLIPMARSLNYIIIWHRK